MNFDASQVGVPYVRAHKITIHYPDKGLPPVVVVEQSLAVVMADKTVRQLEVLPTIQAELNLATDAGKPIPLIDKDTGAPLGPTTTLGMVYMQLLAAVRQIQISQE
jgi:hypothetical protein